MQAKSAWMKNNPGAFFLHMYIRFYINEALQHLTNVYLIQQFRQGEKRYQ
jgi:hypothetical protein